MAAEVVNAQGREFLRALNERGSMRFDRFNIVGDGHKVVEISFLSRGVPTDGKGQFFARFPYEVSQNLPGSYVSCTEFLNQLGKDGQDKPLKQKILGSGHGQLPVFEVGSGEENFKLKVFSGSTNKDAVEILELANKDEGFNNQAVRAYYQRHLYNVVKPVLEKQSDRSPGIRIIDDCLASGDSIAGVLSTIVQATTLHENVRSVRVDVAVATAQGILLLRKFAEDNGIQLELNVGYMAFGLSEGVKSKLSEFKGREHANYIIHPTGFFDEINDVLGRAPAEKIKAKIKNTEVMVVGDMGDAGKSMYNAMDQNNPWNRYRLDSHGDRNNQGNSLINPPVINEYNKSIILYMANGGYIMRAFLHHLLIEQNKLLERGDLSEVMIDAKRRFDEGGLGFGVLVYGLNQDLLIKKNSAF